MRGRQLESSGQRTLSAVIYPTALVVNRDDGRGFLGDSLGSVHIIDMQNEKINYIQKLGNVHRLGISDMVFLQKENTLISASDDGVIRALVGATGQVNFTYYNQRNIGYKAVTSIE